MLRKKFFGRVRIWHDQLSCDLIIQLGHKPQFRIQVNTSTDEVAAEPAPAGEAGDAPPAEEEAKPESDEPKVMTLDEYKKQLGERSGPKFNLRKAGEGSEIDPKWKKTYAYKKEKETHDEEDDEVSFIYTFSGVQLLAAVVCYSITVLFASRGRRDMTLVEQVSFKKAFL